MRAEEVREQSLGSLVQRMQRDLVDLVQAEKALAKKELSLKLDEARTAGTQLAIATVLGLVTVMSLAATLTLALATVLAAWLASSIVTLVIGGVAAATYSHFKSKTRDLDAVPERTIESARRDAQALRRATQ